MTRVNRFHLYNSSLLGAVKVYETKVRQQKKWQEMNKLSDILQ